MSSQPKNSKRKLINISATIRQDQIDRIDDATLEGKYENRSHAVRAALDLLFEVKKT